MNAPDEGLTDDEPPLPSHLGQFTLPPRAMFKNGFKFWGKLSIKTMIVTSPHLRNVPNISA
jgi:hypothetical protein